MAKRGRKSKKEQVNSEEVKVDTLEACIDKIEHAEIVSGEVKLTQALLAKLECAYKFGCTDQEAMSFVGLRDEDLNNLLARYPSLSRFIAAWKRQPLMQAKRVLYESVRKGNVSDAKWLLERLDRQRYGKQIKISQHHTLGEVSSVEKYTAFDVEKKRKALRERTGVIEIEAEEVKEGEVCPK